MSSNPQFFTNKAEAQAATQAAIQNSPYYQKPEVQQQEPLSPNVKRSYFEDPAKIVRWYNAGLSMPAGYQASDWYKNNASNIEAAYKWMEYLNQGKDPSQWSAPDYESDFSKFLSSIPTPPDESLMPWEKGYTKPATEATPVVNPAASAPTLPENAATWQKLYDMFTNTSVDTDWGWNTARVAQSVMAGVGAGGAVLTGGNLLAGGLALTGIGAVPASVIAAATPFAAAGVGIATALTTNAKIKGAEYSEELDTAATGLFSVFNWLSDQAKALSGVGMQMKESGVDEILKDLPSAWEAGKAAAWETAPYSNAAFNLAAVVEKGIRSAVGADTNLTGLTPANIGETWKMSQGEYDPVVIKDKNGNPLYNYKILPTDTPEQALDKFSKFWWTHPGLTKAREDLKAGKSYDEVKAEIVEMFGDSGDTTNFIMSGLVDPTNFINLGVGMGGELVAKAAGKPTLAKAFEASRGSVIADAAGMGAPVLQFLTKGKLRQSSGLYDTMSNYKSMVRAGETLKTGTVTVPKYLKPETTPAVGEDVSIKQADGTTVTKPIVDVITENGVTKIKVEGSDLYQPASEVTVLGRPYQETQATYKPTSELDWFDKHIGGIDENGKVKELVKKGPTGNKLVDWYNEMTSLSDESRAGIFLYNLYDSLGMQAVAATSEPGMTDVMKAQKLIDMWDRMANIDTTAVGDAGETFLHSPLAGTLADSLKGVLGDTKVKDLFAQYINAANQENISRLNAIAATLQLDSSKLVQELRSNPKQVYDQFKVKVANSSDPNVGKLLESLNAAGVLANPVTFANQFAGYTGIKRTAQLGEIAEPKVPYKFEDFRARMVNAVYDYGFEYVKNNFGIKEQSTVYRLSGVLKAAQSLVLLGLSPRYLVNNGVNNLVVRAAQGVFGFLTPTQVDEWWSEMGLVPARLHEGVTPTGGQTYELAGEFAKSMSDIHNMVLGDSQLAKLTKVINSINGKLGIMSNLSQKLESSESVQAYTIGTKAMWSNIWQPEKGFSKMSPQLEIQLKQIDPRLPEFIYAAIQGGKSSKSIEAAIWKDVAGLNLDHAINKALENMAGDNVDLAREGLEKIGALDRLKTALTMAKTKQDVNQAIMSVEHDVKDLIDTYELQKAATFGEELDNILTQEGFQAVPNMFVEMQQRSWDRWLDHYRKLADFLDYIKPMKSDQKSAAWRQFLKEDLEDWQKLSNHELQIYSAILSKKIADGTGGKAVVDLIESRINEYNKVYELRKNLYEAYYAGDPASPKWEDIQTQVDDAFRVATENAKKQQGQIDILLSDMFGPQHKEEILKMRQEIAKIQDDMDFARNDLVREIKAGTSGYDVRTAWSKFQQEVHIPYINKLKSAEVQFGMALNKMEPKQLEDIPDYMSPLRDKIVQDGKDFTTQAKEAYAERLERNDFRAQMKKAFGKSVSAEQWQAIFALAEMRAKRWAAETGKKPADWYRENISAIKKSKPGGLSLKQEEHSWYYSKLQEVTDAIPQNKFTKDQYIGMLTKAGVKPEELKWVDIDACIDEVYQTMAVDAAEKLLSDPKFEDVRSDIDVINKARLQEKVRLRAEGKLDKKLLQKAIEEHKVVLRELVLGESDESKLTTAMQMTEHIIKRLETRIRDNETLYTNDVNRYSAPGDITDKLLDMQNDSDPSNSLRRLRKTDEYKKWLRADLNHMLIDNAAKEYMLIYHEQRIQIEGAKILDSYFKKGTSLANTQAEVNKILATYDSSRQSTGSEFMRLRNEIIQSLSLTDKQRIELDDRLPLLGYPTTPFEYSRIEQYLSSIGQPIDHMSSLYDKLSSLFEIGYEYCEIHKTLVNYMEAREMLKTYDAGNLPKAIYPNINTPGGTNYRELLMYADARDLGSYRAPHFSKYGKDLLGHVRFDDRINANGDKVLAVREIQSDRGQQYSKDYARYKELYAKYEEDLVKYQQVKAAAEAAMESDYLNRNNYTYDVRPVSGDDTAVDVLVMHKGDMLFADTVSANGRTFDEIGNDAIQAFFNSDEPRLLAENSVNMLYIFEPHPPVEPAGIPFKSSWPELLFKRILRYAVENGYSRIELPTGPTAAKIEGHVIFSELDFIARDTNDGKVYIQAKNSNRGPEEMQMQPGHTLAEYVGDDIAKQLMESTPDERGIVKVTGDNVSWGGQKMRWFYDRNLVNIINKYVKKWGAELVESKLETGETTYALDINEDMSASVAKGQPLFQRAKGATTFTEDGRAIIHALTSPDVSTPIHELAHVWRPGITMKDQNILSQWSGLSGAEEYMDLHDKFVKGELKSTSAEYKRYVKSEEMVARGIERVIAEGVEWLPPVAAAVFAKLKTWLLDVYHSIVGTPLDVKITPEARRAMERMFVSDLSRKRVENKAAREQGLEPAAPATTPTNRALLQEAMPAKKMPLDSVPKIMWNSDMLSQAWNGQFSPMLREIGNQLDTQIDMPELKYGAALPADVRASLRSYLRNVYVNEMPGAKLTATRYGEIQRDAALLNYQKRYGFDATLTALMPYELFYTRSFAEWAKRGIDRPSWYAMYARIQEFQRRHEKEGIPSRLRGLAKVAAPWLPDWVDNSLYYDPLKQVFPFLQYTQPFEQMSMDENSRAYAAKDELKKMVAAGEITKQDMLAAFDSKSGYYWDVAMQRVTDASNDSWSNPTTLVGMMMGAPYYAQVAYNLMGMDIPGLGKGSKENISPTPMLSTANAVQQIGSDTPIQGLTDLMSGVIGGPERWTRDKLGLNEMGKYQDVWVDRQLAAMATEDFDINEIMDAMATHSGPLYQQAIERAKYEQTLKTPGVGLAESIKSAVKGKSSIFDVAGALLPTMFPASIISKGELEQRGLLKEYTAAWKKYEAGDTSAVNSFMDKHPEYSARLAQFKDPQMRMRNLLSDRIWDAYNELEGPAKYQVRSALGTGFEQTFLNKTVADTSAIDIPTLAYWAKVLGASVPRSDETKEVLDQPMYKNQSIEIYPTQVNSAVQAYWDWKSENFPNISAIQNEYYRLGKPAWFKQKFPILVKYWEANKKYKAEHPEVQAYLNDQDTGDDRSDEKVLKPSDFEGWDNILLNQVIQWVYSGKDLTKGAKQELYRIWLSSGQPGGTFDTYLDMVKQSMRMK